MKTGKNPCKKPAIPSTPINSLGQMIKKIEEEPLKRDEYSMIRQFLRDKLHK